MNFLHLIMFLLSSASPFSATRGKSVLIFTSSAEENVLFCLFLFSSVLPRETFVNASYERNCVVSSTLGDFWEIMLPSECETLRNNFRVRILLYVEILCSPW